MISSSSAGTDCQFDTVIRQSVSVTSNKTYKA